MTLTVLKHILSLEKNKKTVNMNILCNHSLYRAFFLKKLESITIWFSIERH